MGGGKSRLERARKTARRRRDCVGARRQMEGLQYRRYSAAELFMEERRKKAARVSPSSLRKPETIIVSASLIPNGVYNIYKPLSNK